jgi:hypothetical protein
MRTRIDILSNTRGLTEEDLTIILPRPHYFDNRALNVSSKHVKKITYNLY